MLFPLFTTIDDEVFTGFKNFYRSFAMITRHISLDNKTISFLSTPSEEGVYGRSKRKMQFMQDRHNQHTGHCKVQMPEVHKAGHSKVRALQKACGKIHLP
jgi:hypothetical protein